MNEYYARKVQEQKKEIETIKERTIALNLSDTDCERIASKAGKHGLTVRELLQNFIGDLVDGTYSNGSDERDFANQWFERCWFSHIYDKTLLSHLLDCGRDVDDFLTVVNELQYYKTKPEEFAEEVATLKEGERLWFAENYDSYIEDFMKINKDADIDMEKEIELCRKWLKELQELKDKSEV